MEETDLAKILVIGDTHAPAMLPGYVDFLVGVRKKYKTTQTIHIGDVVDFAAISFHEKNPASPAPGDEYRLALEQVTQIRRAFPTVTVMTGNHDALPRRQARAVGIPLEMIRSHSQIWETPRWDWRPRFTTVEIEGVKYAHGDRGKGGQLAALKNAKEAFSSWVQGHHHSQAGVQYFANGDSLVFGMSVGCGIDRDVAAMDYGLKFSAKPVVGCGVVLDGRLGIFEPMSLCAENRE